MVVKPENFRDLGGLKTATGAVIKERRLLRSGEVVDLSEQEQEALIDAYRLKKIVDFRSAAEVAKRPDDALPGVEYVHIDILRNETQMVPGRQRFQQLRDVDQLFTLMRHVYGITLLDKDAQRGYRQFLDVLLATTDGAVLFHCFAGKDRTGVAAAIILTILGIDEETIFEDYLLTNVLRAASKRTLVSQSEAMGLEQQRIEIFRAAMEAKREYLAHIYTVAAEHYGSFWGFLREALGVTAREVDVLRALYLTTPQ